MDCYEHFRVSVSTNKAEPVPECTNLLQDEA